MPARVGRRPGEKLYEELFDPSEAPLPTDAPGVLSASPRAADIAILRRSFAELEEAAASGDERRVRDLMAHLVPEARLEPAPESHPALDVEAGAP